MVLEATAAIVLCDVTGGKEKHEQPRETSQRKESNVVPELSPEFTWIKFCIRHVWLKVIELNQNWFFLKSGI